MGENLCKNLGGSWEAGTAPELDGVFDITSCQRVSGRNTEIVVPALRDTKWEKARCNDGSPFLFEVNMAEDRSINEWVILLQGGFLCNDDSNIAPCSERSPALSTSLMAPNDRSLISPSKRQGIFSLDSKLNPTFSKMNHVFARYCSSDLWTGSTVETKPTSAGNWYFSGRENVRAMIEILIERYGLDDKNPDTKVLFMGQSAGGIGAIANIDQLIEMLPNTAAGGRLKLATDGGGFPHFKNENYLLLGKMFLDEFAGSNYHFFRSRLNSQCEQEQIANGNHPSECLFISSVYPAIESQNIPFLVIYSLHDKQMLEKHGIDPNLDHAAYKEFGDVSRRDFEGIEWLFAGDRPYHVITTNDQIWNADIQGETLNGVMTKFWNGEDPVRVISE